MVVITYVQGLTERSSRVFKKHGISTGMKPHTSLRKILVHPKDKVDPADKTDCIYEIPCKNCNYTYIGETGRKFRTRLKEHKKEVERLASKSKNFTRQARKAISWGTKQISDSGPCSSIQPCDRLGWCKSVTNGVWLRGPVYPWILVDWKEGNQSHEPWWGGLFFKSRLWPSSDVTGQPSNWKSDEEDGSLWRSSSPMTDETVRLVLNQPWFWLKEIYFNVIPINSKGIFCTLISGQVILTQKTHFRKFANQTRYISRFF